MPRYRLDLASRAEWAPLEQVVEISAPRLVDPHLDADAFMYMGRLVARRLPTVHLYKHVVTRRYLNLDAGGHAYRLDGWHGCGVEDTSVRCTGHRSLLDALAWVLRVEIDAEDRSFILPMPSWPLGSA